MPSKALLVSAALLFGACSGSDETASESTRTATETGATSLTQTSAAAGPPTSAERLAIEELFPDVIEATATSDGDGTWTFSATLSSPYDTPQRYADAWRVLAPDGTELGLRILEHDHANEQPFTRSLPGVEIPAEINSVTIQGRDQVSGWGGATVTVEL
jgi:hypothetical protein